MALASTVEKALHELDRDLPVSNVRSMEQVLDGSIGRQRLAMVLLALFATVAVALAAVGVYGVMSYSVTQQIPELAVRVALGARAGDIFRLVIGQGMRLALLGMVLGLAAALGLTRFVESLLFGVEPFDGLTLTGVCVLLALVAFLACALPARRAVLVDPAIPLRGE
jgi:putative ABC transport system permease protein